ncbi:hypothetical protein [Leifsonia aquatica]|uniref:hypothetical protein n=1 Tax=Leifsonia aquatica TaxID=144185 RepID=UPI0028B21E2B|nr:hypothetical protein [Leifsonia aquatica]
MSVETLPFLAAVRRMIRAVGKRPTQADEFEVAELIELRSEVDRAIQTAVDRMRATGRSCADIATATGASRQAAQQRCGSTERRRMHEITRVADWPRARES